MNGPALYFNTVRHLRPVQVAGRLRLRLLTPRPDLRPAPPVRSPQRRYQDPIAPEPTLIGPDTFRFLALTRRCERACDWQPRDCEKLWVYNLHYFDDLNARAAAERHSWHGALLERWVAENPPGRGVGWEPYPVSRRIVNWVKWAAAGNALSGRCQHSLAVQARWLRRRLEYHLLGNHLLANAKALVHAGLHFEGAEAQAWYAQGLALLGRQLAEQVLADGGHFERSTMYHAAVLEDLLDLVNILGTHGQPVPPEWYPLASSMERWLRVMSHPDGEIGFFNDAALGVAPNAGELAVYGARLGVVMPAAADTALTALEHSGYLKLRTGAASLLCDCAPLGPDFLPGHAHADTLSFELSLGGQRVLVNSGTSCYGTGEQRQRERGTAAHNTVVVDAADSSEVWGGFRVARRARPRVLDLKPEVPLSVEASHDGYRRLPGKNEHVRRWVLEGSSLRITDRVTGTFRSAVAYLHLHPDVVVEPAEAGGLQQHQLALRAPGYRVSLAFEGAASVEVLPGAWHPRFGLAVSNSYLRVRFAADTLTTHFTWTEAP